MTDPTFKTCLWFDVDGLDAAELYCSIFDDAEITNVSYYTDANTYGETGRPLEVDFRLGSQRIPTRLADLMTNSDAAASERVVARMLTMQKLDIAELEAAAEA